MALAHVAKTMTKAKATFHPLIAMMLMSGWYYVVFLLRASVVNLSLQSMYSLSCIVSTV